MKAASDYPPGTQLELDVELGLTVPDIYLHDVTSRPLWFVELNWLHWVACFDFGRNELPSCGVGKVVLKQSVRIANLCRSPIGRHLRTELSATGVFPLGENNQLVSRRRVYVQYLLRRDEESRFSEIIWLLVASFKHVWLSFDRISVIVEGP